MFWNTPKSNGREKGLFQTILSRVLFWSQKNCDETLLKDLLCRRCEVKCVLLLENMPCYIFLHQGSQATALLERFQSSNWDRNTLQCADTYFTFHRFLTYSALQFQGLRSKINVCNIQDTESTYVLYPMY